MVEPRPAALVMIREGRAREGAPGALALGLCRDPRRALVGFDRRRGRHGLQARCGVAAGTLGSCSSPRQAATQRPATTSREADQARTITSGRSSIPVSTFEGYSSLSSSIIGLARAVGDCGRCAYHLLLHDAATATIVPAAGSFQREAGAARRLRARTAGDREEGADEGKERILVCSARARSRRCRCRLRPLLEPNRSPPVQHRRLAASPLRRSSSTAPSTPKASPRATTSSTGRRRRTAKRPNRSPCRSPTRRNPSGSVPVVMLFSDGASLNSSRAWLRIEVV